MEKLSDLRRREARGLPGTSHHRQTFVPTLVTDRAGSRQHRNESQIFRMSITAVRFSLTLLTGGYLVKERYYNNATSTLPKNT